MPKYNIEGVPLKELKTVVISLRGLMLEYTIKVENIINEYLSLYFCKDEYVGNELKEMLLNTERITLGSKKDILFILLNRYHQDYIKLHPKLISNIESIVPHRNIFAHLEMDYSSLDLEDEKIAIFFNKYKNGKLVQLKYSSDDISKLVTDFKEIIERLEELVKTTKAPNH